MGPRARGDRAAEMAIRAEIVAACHEMQRSGLTQGMSGNVSVRCGDIMLITPSAMPYDLLSPGDIVMVSLADGRPVQGAHPPSSEWHFHYDILRQRPEFGAVVHGHPRQCTALAMARRGIPPCHYMIASFGGDDVRCAPYATFGTPDLSAVALDALVGRQACLLANHGMIACGGDLRQAMWRAVELEALAGQYLASLAAGGPVLLTGTEIVAAVERFEGYGR